MNLLYALPEAVAQTVFLPEDRARLGWRTHVLAQPAQGDFAWEALDPALLAEVEVLVTGWRTPRASEAMVEAMPKLALVANASGGVHQHLPDLLWQRGVRVVTSSHALGWGVAEYVLAVMLLGAKRAFWLAQGVRERAQWREETDCFGGSFELFGTEVGLVGAGQSGQHLLRLLREFECRLSVYDPYVSDAVLAAHGARRAESLEALFEQCRVVSIHAPLNERTRHLIRGEHLRRLPQGAVFINAARAGLVHEGELVEALQSGRFVACLDVGLEEPPAPDHPLRTAPNVFYTPHIAGAIRENRFRMGRLVLEEVERFLDGAPLRHEVTLNALATVA